MNGLTKGEVDTLVEELAYACKMAALERYNKDFTVDLADLRDPIRAVFELHGHGKVRELWEEKS